MVTDNLADLDLRYIWHPCSQMKDYEAFKPLIIKKAQGCYIELTNGHKIIDAISSWWCKSLGHAHPRLQEAMQRQMQNFEHVIFANTTNEVIVELSQQLTQLTRSLKKVFYAGDGSCAVEIAMKMSLHARQITEEKQRTKFLALENGYHGETIGALSVSDSEIYSRPYQTMLFAAKFIKPLPYVLSAEGPLWHNCQDYWDNIEKQLEPYANTATAVIVEPIVQGAGGMKIYSQDFLQRLRKWTTKHNIHLIADEIMTGIGRTGKMLACEHAGIEPDFLCLSKGLTSGWMPFSAVLTTNKIYEIFYNDYSPLKSFLHSHTFCGNALGASIALEVLKIFAEEDMCAKSRQLGAAMLTAMHDVAITTKKLKNVRGIGAIVAADLICDDPKRRIGFEVYQKAVKLGALLRPLNNTIYWLPPLNMDKATLELLKQITLEAILTACH
jgi:adenosylmethionine-8-amino-7-oxononanoate aminotransferase